MCWPNRRAGAPAFTLVELLIALLLLSLVLSLVYGAFAQISGRSLELRDELIERQELRLLVRIIADDLQAAQWLEQAASKPEPLPTGIVARMEAFGTQRFTEVSFHAARPARFYRTVDPLADPGLHEVGYYVRQNAARDGLVLVRREDFYLDDDLTSGGVVVVLAEGIEAFQVEFLPNGLSLSAAQERWEDTWDSGTRNAPSRLPVAMRLTLARKDAAGRTLSEALEFNLPSVVKL